MNAIERVDRFTLMMPNGTSMDVSKDGLSPETIARFRASAPPGLAKGGDDKDAELAALEAAADALTEAVGGVPPARYAGAGHATPPPADSSDGGWTEVLSYSPAAVRQARYGTGDDRDAGTLAEGLGSLGEAPVPDAGAPAPPLRIPGPVDLPSIPASAPGAPARALPELTEIEGAPLFTPTVLNQPLPVMGRGELAKLEGDRRMVERGRAVGPDGRVIGNYNAPGAGDSLLGAPTASPPPGGISDADREAFRKAFSESRSESIGVEPPTLAPYQRPKELEQAYATAEETAGLIGVLNAKDAIEREKMIGQFTADNIALNERLGAERDAEYRRQQKMYDDAYSGKIDPDRMFARMDNGQRALTLIGLVLGGIGAGNTGVNAAVGVMERMIDRDIDSQAKDLDRKKSLFGEFLRMGYQREQARQLTKSAMLEAQAGMLARQAAKTASPMAILAAQNAQAEIKLRAEEAFAKGSQQHYMQEMGKAELAQRAAIANAQLRQSERNAKLQAAATALKAQGDMDELAVTVAPGKVVYGATKESAQKLRDANTARLSIKSLAGQAKRQREVNHRAWTPGGVEAKDAEILQTSLIGQLNKMFEFGALDVRTLELLKSMVPNVGNIVSWDDATISALDKIAETVEARFNAAMTSSTRGGKFYGFVETEVQ